MFNLLSSMIIHSYFFMKRRLASLDSPRIVSLSLLFSLLSIGRILQNELSQSYQHQVRADRRHFPN